MKSYSHLWEKFISEENIKEAVKNAARGSKSKHIKKKIRKIRDNPGPYIEKIQYAAENFHNGHHVPKEIYDGISRKKRMIIVPNYMEQIIHHMAVNILKPIFMRGMYYHSNGSIPGRGAHKGKKHIEKWIKHDPKNFKYVLKMDIRKYFDSVSQDILKQKLKRIIRDEKFLRLLFEIIDVSDKGIPLGFYTSQWFANFYLQDLDHFIKEHTYAPHYERYVDDIVIAGANKKKLHQTRKEIDEYCRTYLALEVKGNWQVFRFDYERNGKRYGRPLDFMGFLFFRNRTVIRKKIFLRATRKAARIFRKEKVTWFDATQILSYLGWFSCSNTYGSYKKYIKNAVNVRSMKRKIGAHARRMNDDTKLQNR